MIILGIEIKVRYVGFNYKDVKWQTLAKKRDYLGAIKMYRTTYNSMLYDAKVAVDAYMLKKGIKRNEY